MRNAESGNVNAEFGNVNAGHPKRNEHAQARLIFKPRLASWLERGTRNQDAERGPRVATKGLSGHGWPRQRMANLDGAFVSGWSGSCQSTLRLDGQTRTKN